LPDLNQTSIFLLDFLDIQKYWISWKSIYWEPSCSKHTDRHGQANSHVLQFWEHA